jgi:hypothetical protein
MADNLLATGRSLLTTASLAPQMMHPTLYSFSLLHTGWGAGSSYGLLLLLPYSNPSSTKVKSRHARRP